MKNFRIFFLVFFGLTVGGLFCLNSQQSSGPVSGLKLDQQYEEYITKALRFQVKADSLSRTANQIRRELAFSGNASRRKEMESQVLSLENESYFVQRKADSLYSQARATELRIIAAGKEAGGNILTTATHGTASISGTSFLVLGDTDISSVLTSRELLLAAELEPDYDRATTLLREASELSDEIEQLGHKLDSGPRRRERRRINRRIDELKDELFDTKLEAMQIFEKVNGLRYIAAARFIEEKRKELTDSLIIRSGLIHEEHAEESFRQAGILRETASGMRSDKYLEGFMLRAYTEELKAFNEMEKALEIYNTPAVPFQDAITGVPFHADGRIDPGLALSRARSAGSGPIARTGQEIDFGFAVLPETPYSAQNPVPANVVLPEGMVYSVQLGIFNTVMAPASFGGLYPVMAERDPGSQSVRYYTGVFRTIADAEKALIEVNRQGFGDAFVVAYNYGRRMPVNRARQMERGSQNSQAAATQTGSFLAPASNAGTPQTESSRTAASNAGTPQADVPRTPATVADRPSPTVEGTRAPEIEKAVIVTYRVQLGAFSKLLEQDVYRRWQNIAGLKRIDYNINNKGLYIYSTGNFNTFDEAARMRELFRQNGVTDAFIIPYKGDLRISMEEANQLLHNQ